MFDNIEKHNMKTYIKSESMPKAVPINRADAEAMIRDDTIWYLLTPKYAISNSPNTDQIPSITKRSKYQESD